MKKILKFAPVVCVTLLILSSCTSCKRVKWDWTANPYSADHNTQALYTETEEVSCTDPKFSEFTCFDFEDMAELVYNIKRIQRSINKSTVSKRTKRRVNYKVNELLKSLPTKGEY